MILLRHGQSEFNVVFSVTRRDPGIPDPRLTETGRAQAAEAARTLAAGRQAGQRISRIIVSPYTRALQTAAIVSEILDLPVSVVNAEVRERYAFVCDVGTPTSVLARDWPLLDFSHLAEQWWPSEDEPTEAIEARARKFRAAMAAETGWNEALVVSHWGFILSMTGESVPNGAIRRCDPRDPHPAVSWHH